MEGPSPAGNGATQRGGGHGQTDRQYSQTQGSLSQYMYSQTQGSLCQLFYGDFGYSW